MIFQGDCARQRAWWAEPILDLSECPRASLTCQAIVNFRSGAAVALREPGRYGREAEREFMAETGTTDFSVKRRKAALQNLRPAQCSSLLSSRSLLSNLRRTISAILWRHENGAKWRSLPSELGPWWMAAHTLIRWARLGGWERLLNLVQEHGIKLGMNFLDGKNVRMHQKAAVAARKGVRKQRDHREALGRSRGGYGTKACMSAESLGRAVAFRIAPGQAHELPEAIPLLDSLPDVPNG